MLKNLLKTWEILAPDEVNYDPSCDIFTFGEGTAHQMGGSLSFIESTFYSQCCLQGYIQRCIEDRGWQLFLVNTKSYFSIEIQVESTRYKSGDLKASKKLIQTLLTAYLMAIAAQRTITRGAWRHFKGGEVEVLGVFPFGTRDCEDGDFTIEGNFVFEDDPTLSFQLLCWGDGHMEFQHTALSLGFLPDRVAYLHDGKGYLRLPSNFLGIVDAKHPEHEGLLRFVEVPSEQS